ncbi:MAG TPA: helicase C-terminal domain-containing protein [Longimicrobiales bacterium]
MSRVLHLSGAAARHMRAEIAEARGNEVCFVARVGEAGEVYGAEVVARGNRNAVVAAVRDVEAGMLVIHNHPTGVLEPSDPDLTVAAELHARGVGLAITDNDVSELYVVVEPAPRSERELLDPGEIEAALAPGGALGRAHPSYEDRPMQREFALAVAAAYNEGGVTLAEAGTGTGKSVAYLLPAIRWAMANRERTVVSTNTINLQEQLVEKDLPFLRRALAEPFRFALVKGRRNYISIRRARLAAQSAAVLFDDAQRAELEAILSWIDHTRDGSLQDLSFQPTSEVWDEVASESDVCLRARCPHFDACFYQRARRDAAHADVLVVNHHLLFSDLAVRRAQGNYTAQAVLPPYGRVVLDEAHNLEDAATRHLGASFSRRTLLRLLGRLDRRGRGVLPAVEERLKAGPDDLLQQDALRQVSMRVRPAVERARERTAALFDGLEALVAEAEDGVVRIDAEAMARPDWSGRLVPDAEDLAIVLDELARELDRLRERILLDTRWSDALEEQLLELQATAGRTRTALDALRLLFRSAADEPVAMVRWIERRGRGGDGADAGARAGRSTVVANVAPVDISELLREGLFERVDTAVLTSATLTTRDGFDFVRRRIGLAAGGLKVRTSVYPSPFDYEEQALVAIPTDLPVPGGGQSAAFDAATARVVEALAEVCDGGLFVLFTAHRSLRRVATDLRRREVDRNWPLFVQGEGPRARLVEHFAASGHGILLGVASFWEGVDVPGRPLRGLVIPKLPFKVPSEPLTAARTEAIRREGGDGFYDYALPHAALRLKQGFGRLIRSRTDHGVIVLLDRRIIEKGYGRYFLESLPPAPVRAAPWHELLPALRGFYGAHA